MTYTNAQYTNPENTSIRCDINGVTSYVPVAPGNSDYAKIQELVVLNELTIAPYEPPAPPPVTQITMRQARLQLLSSGLLDDVETLITQADKAVQIEWEYATTVQRDSELVVTIGSELGLTEQDIDQMFMSASTL
jgi:hypothetical protein